ncbi:hypothetical protein [Methanofollis fontis]|uniref:hypothetical protein n=1 Tax=Methanofollis fontis TaxID=2052832 RepID=UPI001F3CC010|nr:hypothetical protein [Methanofollis fontis]
MKAVLYGRGMRRIITHSVFELLREIDDPALLSFRRDAKHQCIHHNPVPGQHRRRSRTL